MTQKLIVLLCSQLQRQGIGHIIPRLIVFHIIIRIHMHIIRNFSHINWNL